MRRIGHGGEATVYELTGGRVLRVDHGTPHDGGRLPHFYRTIGRGSPTFSLPEIFERGEDAGVSYSVDRLIAGRPLHELLTQLAGDQRRQALASYTDAAFGIASLPIERGRFGEFLRGDDSITAATWPEYLMERLRQSLAASPWLASDVPELAAKVADVEDRIERLPPVEASLVHGDYFPGNVLIGDDLRVSGVIDFGPLTVIGDPWMDLASALIFLEVARPGYAPDDSRFVEGRLVERVGEKLLERVGIYRTWYAIRFAPYRDEDPNLYQWCVASLLR